QQHFVLFVSAQRQESIIGNYEAARGGNAAAMQAADWNMLQILRSQFEQRSRLLEEYRKGIRQTDVENFMRTNPNFAFLKSLTPEKATEAIKTYSVQLFMQASGTEIDQLMTAQRANNFIRSTEYYKNLEARFKQVTGKNALPEAADWTALNDKDRRAILYPGFMKGFFKRDSPSLSQEILADIQFNKDRMSLVIGESLKKDPTFVARVLNAASTAGVLTETPVGVTSMAGAQTEVGKREVKTATTAAKRELLRREKFRSKNAQRKRPPRGCGTT